MTYKNLVIFFLLFVVSSCGGGNQGGGNQEEQVTIGWERKSPMSTGRAFLTSSVLNNRLYAIGGAVAAFTSVQFDTVEMYDPENDVWQFMPNLPHPSWALTSGVIDNSIYVVDQYPNGFVYRYDQVQSSWLTMNSILTPRRSASTSVVNGRLYTIGGWIPAEFLSTVEAYDPLTDTWTAKNSMPTPRDSHTSSVVNGKIYVIGGRSGTLAQNQAVVEEYDPVLDEWSTKSPMPTPRNGMTSSVLDGRIYVFGGMVSGSASDIVEIYDPETDSWSQTTSMSSPRYLLSSGVINNTIYIVGGAESLASFAGDERGQLRLLDGFVPFE